MFTNREEHSSFWKNALTWSGSVTPKVMKLVIFFSLYSLVITCLLSGHTDLDLDVGPFEVSGAILGLLLVVRTNAGYDRWWEARKLWGGIVNQSRNLVISALQYGPQDLEWKKNLVKWAAAFPHVAKRSLRGEMEFSELSHFLSSEEIDAVLDSRHMPSYVVDQLARCIHFARVQRKLDDFSFLAIDRERTALVDYIGACERILKTPIPLVIAIKVRRFILLFLLLVPFVLLQKVGWSTPIVMFLISYPILALDQIGIELQSPFRKENLSHLPLNEISKNIEDDLFGFLESHLSASINNVD